MSISRNPGDGSLIDSTHIVGFFPFGCSPKDEVFLPLPWFDLLTSIHYLAILLSIFTFLVIHFGVVNDTAAYLLAKIGTSF